ncbi:hypothetical protein [Haladaptatus sp. NG-WS-4]
MNRQRSTSLVLVLVVVLAGCSGIGGSDTTTTTTKTTTTTSEVSTSASTETTTTDTTTATSTETTTTDTTTATSTETTTTTAESWSPPKAPNKPIDDKREPGRIKSVTFTNKVEAKSGNGYTNFDVEVVANTSMPGVDPEPLVDGDPYFLVRINGQRVARAGVRFQHDEGTYSVEIDEGAFQQFDSGTLQVEVLLLDKDKQTDDLYGKWTGTIQYSSK